MKAKKFHIGNIQFVPNTNFWILFLTALVIGGWSLYENYQAHEVLNDELAELYTKWEGFGQELVVAQSEAKPMETSQLAPKFIVALMALLGILFRKIIDWSLKLNKTFLLQQAKFRGFTQKPVILRLGSKTLSYQPNSNFWYLVVGLFFAVVGTATYLHYSNQQMENEIAEMRNRTINLESLYEEKNYGDDVMGYFIDYFTAYNQNQKAIEEDYRKAFLIQKHFVVSKFLIEEKVARVDQLSNTSLLHLNHRIAQLFEDLVLKKLNNIEPHVYEFFTDTTDLDKLETALMEQAKYHVPASITLAQAALETAWGRRIVRNNYFGIKDKSRKSSYMETTEYYNEKEFRHNKHKIINHKLVKKGGKTLYKCRVKDSFVEYESPWASFRAHSHFLSNNTRYSPLFTKGKDYKAWADKIGSTKYGGVGYATSPIYGELLRKIIGRYHLDLLDY